MQSLLRAEQSYHQDSARNRRILNLTVGAVFLGTPFKGSWETGYTNARLWYKIALLGGDGCSPELIQYLRSDRRHDNHGEPSPLTSMIDRFAAMANDGKYKFPIMCFFEEKPAKFEPLVRGIPDEILELFGINRGGQDVVSLTEVSMLSFVEWLLTEHPRQFRSVLQPLTASTGWVCQSDTTCCINTPAQMTWGL